MQAGIAFLDIFEKRRMRDAELRCGGSCRDIAVLILAVEAVESLGKGLQSPSPCVLRVRDLGKSPIAKRIITPARHVAKKFLQKDTP